MRHLVVVALLFMGACTASAQYVQTSSEEPFTGAPLGVGMAKGGLGFSWGAGPAVAVFDVKTGEAKGEFAGHSSEVTAGSACAGVRLVATGDAAGVVRIWDPATRKERIKIEARSSPVRWLAWAPTGGFVAVVTEDKVLTVWRVETGARVVENALPPGATADIQFSADGDRLVLLQREREIKDGEVASSLQVNDYDLMNGGRPKQKVWDRVDTDQAADPYAGARADARSRRTAVIDGDEILIWTMDDNREVCRLEGGAGAVAWRRDGKILVARGRDLVLANAQSGKVEKKWKGLEGIEWLVASEDGRTAVGGGPRGGAVWKLGTSGDPEEIGGASEVLPGKSVIVVRDSSGHGTAIRTEDGSMTAVDGDAPDPASNLPAVALSLEDDTILYVSDGRPVAHSFNSASDVTCGDTRSAPVLGILCAGDNVAAWGATSWTLRDGSGKELAKGAGRPVKARGRWLAVRTGHTLSILDANAGQDVIDFASADAFDLQDNAVAVLDDGEAVVYSLSRSKELFRVAASRATDIALSHDGSRVAFDNGALAVWDTGRSKKTSSQDLRGPLAGLQWHPGGDMLAALTQAGEFRLFGEDGDALLQTDHAALPTGSGPTFAFSNDGTRMAVAWNDGLRLYDLANGIKATVLKGSTGSPEFSPRGEAWILRNGADTDIYEDGSCVTQVTDAEVVFCGDGKLAAAGTSGVRIWNGKWREALTTDAATHVSVSADGKRVALSTGTKLIVFEK